MFACFSLFHAIKDLFWGRCRGSTGHFNLLLPIKSSFLAPLSYIHTTCISLSLCRSSAPIHLTSVLGVLGTQETSYILTAGFLERDTFDHFLPEFDKPWVIHLRKNLLLFYKPLHLEAQQLSTRIEVRRHQSLPVFC